MEGINLAGAVLKEGSVLNQKYTVEYLIGTGGFGRTYRMRDNLLNIPVAVKELTNPEEKDKRQFLKEARVMARFSQNQGIVNVRDFFEANETAYIVMEYLDGMDLCEYVKAKGPISMDTALEKLCPVMEALAVVHKEGFIHRDVSPDNIRITSDGQMKLLDFGAARDIGEEGSTMAVLLKKGYTPEEQYRAKKYQGPWTDVYAFSGVLYYCITGKVPVDCIQRLFHDDLKAPSQLGARIDNCQEAALLKGLALRAEDRYDSMEALRNALLSFEEKPEAKEYRKDAEKEISVRESEKNSAADNIWDRIEAQKAEQDKKREKESVAGEENQQKSVPEIPENKNLQKLKETRREQKETKREQKETKREQKETKGERKEIREERKETRRQRKGKEKKRGLLIAFFAVTSVVVLAALSWGFLMLWSVNPYRTSDNDSYSTISDKTVTLKDIQKIEKDSKCRILALYYCEVSDQIIEAIARLENVHTLNLDFCSGFTDLTPLASMPDLTDLSILGKSSDPQVVDGGAWFREDLPRVTRLSLSGYEKMAGTDFLKHFPALESFYIPLEGYDSLEFFRYMDNMRRISIETDLTGVDLSPIENCRHLESLTLADTNIDDLSMVSGMEELIMIDVANCRISDIRPLKNCSALQRLYLDGNQISDLSSLEGMDNLKTLCLNRNQVEDITPLAGLGLWRLELGENQIQDISPLRNCKDLQFLYLQENQLQDVSALADCRGMESLNLSGNQLEDLSGCETMISLTSFYAKDNLLTDIGGIANSTSLQYVDLSGNQIEDIQVLSGGFTSLRGLNINDNLVQDVKALEKCEELRYLMADRNEIASLAPLKNASQLNAVFADENRLTDLEGLGNKENLFAITAYGNQVESINDLATCPNLLYLDLGKNRIQDITPFSGSSLKRKGMVFLEHNQIQDFSRFPLKSGYNMLVLYDNPADDLSFIAEIENANSYSDSFYLPYGKDTDYKFLGELGMGEQLHLVDVPLNEQAAILKQAEELDINRIRGGVRFDTGDEADQAMEKHRTELKEECNQELRMLEGDAIIADLLQ